MLKALGSYISASNYLADMNTVLHIWQVRKNPNNWCSTDMIWSYYLARAVKKKFAGR